MVTCSEKCLARRAEALWGLLFFNYELEEVDSVPSLLGDEEETVERFDKDDVEYADAEQQLEQFSKAHNSGLNNCCVTVTTLEKEAAALFLMGSKLEQEGALYEAVNYYRRAMQLVPDIESRVSFQSRGPRERQESESSVDSYDGEDEAEKLATRFQQVQINENRLCHPEYPQRTCHISALPVELLIYIFKWVISSQLDMKSLEHIALVCRGFYLCARDEELWKLACVKTWGGNLGKVKRFGSYRNMYLERPHLQFVGCYISKMSYLRQGEKSLDGFYSPWHQIEYYRYIRFFSEGRMFMVSTAEDPYVTLPQMKYKTSRLPGMMKGVYKLLGNRVTGVLKRVQAPDSTIGYKYKRNKNQKSNEIQYTYYVELEIQSSGKKNGNKLVWLNYSVRIVNKNRNEDTESKFGLTNQTYPPLVFSRVKSFAQAAFGPLI
ncbi:F-box only protein 9-like [Mya arenaria]|uniref:F-box only protein 9-like n=1 Tax=Mya arenaria TaxID=6604 RepID=UPI0022E4274D|nr:F-box only protein 9-like [Mya arenaria]